MKSGRTIVTCSVFGAALAAAALVIATGAGHGDDGTEVSGDIRYEVTAVKRKLVRELEDGSEERLAVGSASSSGDVLRTGWMSSAEITAPDWASRFALAARTRVRLAHEVPGMLLVVEEGRIRATFDALPEAGSETASSERERIVTTPSVVLAVRGTVYGVEVDGDGETTVVVFEGAVEAVDASGEGEPVRIEPGFACRFRRGHGGGAQWRHGLGSDDWDRGASAYRHRFRGGTQTPSSGTGGTEEPGRGSMGGGGTGGSGSGGQGQHRGGGSGRHGG